MPRSAMPMLSSYTIQNFNVNGHGFGVPRRYLPGKRNSQVSVFHWLPRCGPAAQRGGINRRQPDSMAEGGELRPEDRALRLRCPSPPILPYDHRAANQIEPGQSPDSR